MHPHTDPSLGRIISSRLETGFGVESAVDLSLGRTDCLWNGSSLEVARVFLSLQTSGLVSLLTLPVSLTFPVSFIGTAFGCFVDSEALPSIFLL